MENTLIYDLSELGKKGLNKSQSFLKSILKLEFLHENFALQTLGRILIQTI